MRGRLQIGVLGELTVALDGKPVPLPASKKTRALLAYLAVVGRPLRRDHLCELLWEAPDDPRAALRWSLHKIRRITIPRISVLRCLLSPRPRPKTWRRAALDAVPLLAAALGLAASKAGTLAACF